jgi:hypothetical protein
MQLQEQAESCRRQAAHYSGRPEGPFLLSVARVFEELAGAENPSAFVQMKGRGARASRPTISA